MSFSILSASASASASASSPSNISMAMIYNIYEYIIEHITQIIFFGILIYVTIFRREISCNSDYSDCNNTTSLHSIGSTSLGGKNTSNNNNLEQLLHHQHRRQQKQQDQDEEIEQEEFKSSNKEEEEEEEDYSFDSNNDSHDYTNISINIETKPTAYYSTTNNINNKNNNDMSTLHSTESSSLTLSSSASLLSSSSSSLLLLELAPDLQLYCFSFLHPKDITSFSCCNKLTRFLIDDTKDNDDDDDDDNNKKKKNCCNNNIDKKVIYNNYKNNNNYSFSHQLSFSNRLWLTLWERDYGWIVTQWNIGIDATKRSLQQYSQYQYQYQLENSSMMMIKNNHSIPVSSIVQYIILSPFLLSSYSIQQDKDDGENNTTTMITTTPTTATGTNSTTSSMKEFYLTFSQIWINYTIAGQSTLSSCYTSIHGHIFNITNFLTKHPGSLDTLLVKGGGRDATTFFESVGHSLSARKVAVRELVEVINLECCTFLEHSGDIGFYDDCHKNGSSSRRNRRNGRRQNNSSTRNHEKKKYHSSFTTTHEASWQLCGLKQPNEIRNNNNYNNLCLLPKARSRPTRMSSTLVRIRHKIQEGEENAKKKAASLNNVKGGMYGEVNVFYDPLCCRWMGWYLNLEFEPMFVDLE